MKKEHFILMTVISLVSILLMGSQTNHQNEEYIYKNGKLAVTAFEIQQNDNGVWRRTEIYVKNKKYRARMRMQNNHSTSGKKRRIFDIKVQMKLQGGKWESNQSSYQDIRLLTKNGSRLLPQREEWFDLGVFTWQEENQQIKKTPIELSISHREEILIGAPKSTKVVPTTLYSK